MAEPSLGALGNGGAIRRAKVPPVDDRPVLDVNKPFDIGYCTFDQPFFNTGGRTLHLGQSFSAGDSFTEGLIKRMVMHPGGMVEVLLESQGIPGKTTVVIAYNPKDCSPLAVDAEGVGITTMRPGAVAVGQKYRSALADKET